LLSHTEKECTIALWICALIATLDALYRVKKMVKIGPVVFECSLQEPQHVVCLRCCWPGVYDVSEMPPTPPPSSSCSSDSEGSGGGGLSPERRSAPPSPSSSPYFTRTTHLSFHHHSNSLWTSTSHASSSSSSHHALFASPVCAAGAIRPYATSTTSVCSSVKLVECVIR